MIAVRVFRAVWFLSILVSLAVVLYHYASWPEDIVIGQREINFITLSRDSFFYSLIGILAFVNVTVFVVRQQAKKTEALVAWYFGLIAIINFFLIIAISFVSLFNSNESFRFEEIGFVIYGSLFLIGAWFLGGLLYWFIPKKTE